MNRIEAWRGILDSFAARKITAGKEIFGAASDTAIFEARRNSLPAASVNANTAGRLGSDAPVCNIDEGGSPKAILRRKSARDEIQITDETRFQNIDEPRNSRGQHNAVDPVLHIAVLVSDVEWAFAACRGVLVHARR